jgi:hypothetical protein
LQTPANPLHDCECVVGNSEVTQGARRADGFLREMPLEEVEENLPSTRHQNQAVFEVFLGVSNAEG